MTHRINLAQANAYVVPHGTLVERLREHISLMFCVDEAVRGDVVPIQIFGPEGHLAVVGIETYHDPVGSAGYPENPAGHFARYISTIDPNHCYGYMEYASSPIVISDYDKQPAGYLTRRNGKLVARSANDRPLYDLCVIDFALKDEMLWAMTLSTPLIHKLLDNGKLRSQS